MKKNSLNKICVFYAGFFLVCMALGQSKRAFAGAEGHGGVAVVCRDEVGKIRSAEMLDLFEARNLFDLRVSNADIQPERRLQNIVNRMSSNVFFQTQFQATYEKQKKITRVLPRAVAIIPTDDSFPKLKQKNCRFENVAVWTPDDRLLVDEEIHSVFDSINRFALEVHETSYAIARSNLRNTNSVLARKLVAYLLADAEHDELITELISEIASPLVPGIYSSKCISPSDPTVTITPVRISVVRRSANGLTVKDIDSIHWNPGPVDLECSADFRCKSGPRFTVKDFTIKSPQSFSIELSDTPTKCVYILSTKPKPK